MLWHDHLFIINWSGWGDDDSIDCLIVYDAYWEYKILTLMCILCHFQTAQKILIRTILGGLNWDGMAVSLVGAYSRAIYVIERGC